MKCLLQFYLEGQLVNSLNPNYRLSIKVNEKEFFFGVADRCEAKISRMLTVWDPHPEWYACFIEITLFDISNRIKKTSIGTFKYNFSRRLNQKMTYFPKCHLGKYLKHEQTDATSSEFHMPSVDPILGESTLNLLPYPGSRAGPVYLSKYFEEFNRDQILAAKQANDPWIVLLKVHHSVSMEIEQGTAVYYQTVLKKTSAFPVMTGAIEGLIEENNGSTSSQSESDESSSEVHQKAKKNSKRPKKRVKKNIDRVEESEERLLVDLIEW